MDNYDKIYPNLEEYNKENLGGDFRLNKINAILNKLQDQVEHYEKVCKKCHKVRKIFHNSSVLTGTVSTLFTGSGIAASLTGIGAIAGIPLSSIGVGLGLTSAIIISFNKRITKKIIKHEKILQLAITKKNSIENLVSKSLVDNKIDDKEFEIIVGEMQKYEKLRSSIRTKKNLDYLKKDSPDIQAMKEELTRDIMSQLVNRSR